jgi:hypothetical protein
MKASALALSALLAVVSGAPLARAQICANARPTEPGGAAGIGYGAAEVGYYDSPGGRARVHYALAGVNAPPPASTLVSDVPDAIVVAAEAADDALKLYLELGYSAPLGDGDSPCADNGGSEALDVYVLNFAAADGQALYDHCKAGSPRVCAGFVLVENDYRGGGYADAAEGMRTVVPHELFHLVQDAYDSDLERWWAEGSAQWAAKHVYPELGDLERFLPAYFESPWRPLNVPPTGVVASFLYATAIWPVFLEQQYGSELPRRVYEQLGGGEANVLDATDVVLKAEGSDLPSAFAKFALLNAATGSRAPRSGGYDDAADYPEALITEELEVESGDSLEDIMSGFGTFYYQLHAESPVELELDADPARVTATLLPLVQGRAELDAAEPLPAKLDGDAIVVVTGQSQARTDAPFTLHVQGLPSGGSDGGGDATKSSSCALGRPAGHSGLATSVWLGIVVSLVLRSRSRRSQRERIP